MSKNNDFTDVPDAQPHDDVAEGDPRSGTAHHRKADRQARKDTAALTQRDAVRKSNGKPRA
ncbi:hypothetical protein [Longispora albida]|uniref:hypothetical protein n=1 Tax=Longispora albida TaxID=203523 RepID=UPI0003745A46|nr:hypothetical protein [Longispora albida]